jgi:hypothetical protein
MKHSLSYIDGDDIRVEYRETHQYTLDEAEMHTVAPVARVY